MMQRTSLELTEGQTGRLKFNIVAPEGTRRDLVGAVRVGEENYMMELEGDDVLLFGALPRGSYLYEVRVGGCTVLYGHIRVKTSPLATVEGVVGWAIDYDTSGATDVVNCYLSEGPQGRQGEKGDKGDPGEEGPRGPQGVPGILAAQAEVHEVELPEGTAEAVIAVDVFTVEHGGMLEALSYRAAADADVLHAQALFVHVWREDGEGFTHLGASAEAFQQLAGEVDTWPFEGVEVQAGDVLHVRFAESPVAADDMELSSLGVVVRDVEGEQQACRGVRVVEYLQVEEVLRAEFERAMEEGDLPAALEGLMDERISEALVADDMDVSTPESGAQNRWWLWCQVAADYVPEGELAALVLRCSSQLSESAYVEPLKISVYEADAEGNFVPLAGSLNAVTPENGKEMRFEFAPGVRLHGRIVRVCSGAGEDGAAVWEMSRRLETLSVDDTAGSFVQQTSARQNFLPCLTFCVRGEGRFAPASHVEDEQCHVTPEERAAWNAAAEAAGGASLTEQQQNVLAAFEWDATYGLSLVHYGADGAVDGRLRLMVNSGAVNLVSGYPVTLQAAQVNVVGRTESHTYTDSQAGISYSFGGHTLSETEMAPYGITEPCVWYGDAALPLLLRGSVLKINGTEIDVAKLASLQARADELLGLL